MKIDEITIPILYLANHVSNVDSIQTDVDRLLELISQNNVGANRVTNGSNIQTAGSNDDSTLIAKLKDDIMYLRKLIFKMQKNVAINLCSLAQIQSDETIEIGDTHITIKTKCGS